MFYTKYPNDYVGIVVKEYVIHFNDHGFKFLFVKKYWSTFYFSQCLKFSC